MTLKGRHWVMLWLVVALGTLGSVAARQTRGFTTAQALRAARDERAGLESQRGELDRRIRQASSRQVLVPRAEANLGLHEPAAAEITVLPLPTDVAGGLPAEAIAGTDGTAADTARAVKKPAAKPRAAAHAPARKPPARKAATRPRPRTRHR
ncbi:MAG: hypothetical protein JF590_06115 [Gemmatimonadetes bacterium]|nr:hypothetical protein [Gemmatimonadota bacterium]